MALRAARASRPVAGLSLSPPAPTLRRPPSPTLAQSKRFMSSDPHQPSQPSNPKPSAAAAAGPNKTSNVSTLRSEHKHSKHDHSHSHSSLNPFHSHSHSHSHNGPSPDTLRDALRGKGDQGSRITLYGLASNVGLTGLKLIAGWRFNSASLLAEAGHSASDLLGDFVTLFCYKMSRRPPTKLFPHGLGKFDAVGMWTVSAILVMGSIGIGLHSYNLLTMIHFEESNVFSHLPHLPGFLPTHAHSHDIELDENGMVLDPNAAWIAALSVVVKEWMYRITKKVGDEENSSVLLANALHHRSDAFTSFIALLSILGSHAGLPVLDPLGGMLVSLLLLKQSSTMTWTSTLDLLDASCDPAILRDLDGVLADLQQESADVVGSRRWVVKSVKGLNGGAGARIEVDLVFVSQPGELVGLGEAEKVGRFIEERLKEVEAVDKVRVSFTEVTSQAELTRIKEESQ